MGVRAIGMQNDLEGQISMKSSDWNPKNLSQKRTDMEKVEK